MLRVTCQQIILLIPKFALIIEKCCVSNFNLFHSHDAALSNNQCHDNALLGINNMVQDGHDDDDDGYGGIQACQMETRQSY